MLAHLVGSKLSCLPPVRVPGLPTVAFSALRFSAYFAARLTAVPTAFSLSSHVLCVAPPLLLVQRLGSLPARLGRSCPCALACCCALIFGLCGGSAPALLATAFSLSRRLGFASPTAACSPLLRFSFRLVAAGRLADALLSFRRGVTLTVVWWTRAALSYGVVGARPAIGCGYFSLVAFATCVSCFTGCLLG